MLPPHRAWVTEARWLYQAEGVKRVNASFYPPRPPWLEADGQCTEHSQGSESTLSSVSCNHIHVNERHVYIRHVSVFRDMR